jgi:hypothetical protein
MNVFAPPLDLLACALPIPPPQAQGNRIWKKVPAEWALSGGSRRSNRASCFDSVLFSIEARKLQATLLRLLAPKCWKAEERHFDRDQPTEGTREFPNAIALPASGGGNAPSTRR